MLKKAFLFTESNILTSISSSLWGKKSWWTTFQFDFLTIFLYFRAHCEIEKWLVRLSGLRSGTVTAGSQGRYHLPCLSFVIFIWFRTGGRGDIICLVWDLCDKKSIAKTTFSCQVIATNIFGENVAGLVKPALKSRSNIMNGRRWRDLFFPCCDSCDKKKTRQRLFL